MSETMSLLIGWYIAVNALTYGLFALDKRQAVRNAWRVPERHLLVAVMLGGWAGALLAMRICRHKRRKTAFLLQFVLALVLHLLMIMGVFLVLSGAESVRWQALFSA